jgi:hypothetical protein
MGQTGVADNLVTLEGTIYENVTIVSANPERMLIVHDGGGCQVEYADLAGPLSAEQRKTVEEELKVYAERQVRIERLRQEAEAKRVAEEAFAQAQRDKGLILFEGDWMKPADRQEVLAARELDRLEQERVRVELEKQKAELRKAQLLAEQERQRLEAQRKASRRTYTYYYSYPSRSYSCCGTSSCRHKSRHNYSSHRYRYPKNSFGVSFSTGGNSISLRSGTSSYFHNNSRQTKRSYDRTKDCR